MINFTGKYMMVFEPQIKLNVSEKKVFANLTSSRKDKRTDPPTYIRSTWFDVAFVGEAFELAKTLSGGEVINVTKGAITNEKSSKNNKYYTNLTVFEFELVEKNESPKNSDSASGNDVPGSSSADEVPAPEYVPVDEEEDFECGAFEEFSPDDIFNS